MLGFIGLSVLQYSYYQYWFGGGYTKDVEVFLSRMA
jgi:hypothetical protein